MGIAHASVLHTNETDHLYPTFEALNEDTQRTNEYVAETNVQTAHPLSQQLYVYHEHYAQCQDRTLIYTALTLKESSAVRYHS